MSKQQKYLAFGGVGLIVVYFLYRWYQNQSASSSTTTTGATTPTDQTASDLAGTEQADVAALQGQEQNDVGQLQTTEQNDYATLTGGLATLSGDLTGLQSTVGSLQANQAGAAGVTGGGASSGTTPNPIDIFLSAPPSTPVLTGSAPAKRTPSTATKARNAATKAVTRAQPKKALGGGTHSTVHQAGNSAHTGGHAGGAVAPRSHNQRAAGQTHAIPQAQPQHPAVQNHPPVAGGQPHPQAAKPPAPHLQVIPRAPAPPKPPPRSALKKGRR